MKIKILISLFVVILIIIFFILIFPEITNYLILAFIVSMLLKKPTNYLNNIRFFHFRIPRFVAILISYILLITIISTFFFITLPSIVEQLNIISKINIERATQKISLPFTYIEDFLKNYLPIKENFIQENIYSTLKGIMDNYDWSSISNIFNNIISFTGSFFIYTLAIFFISFFFLYEEDSISKRIVSLIPNTYFEIFILSWKRIDRLLSNYILGLLIQMSIIFILISSGLLIIDTNYSFTIALFASLANIIPFLGPFIGFLFAIVINASSHIGILELNEYLFLIFKISLVFAFTQLIDNIFLQPFIFSRSIKEHPLVIFICIFIGATINGVVGMIFAIPIYATLRLFYQEFFQYYKKYKILYIHHFTNYVKYKKKDKNENPF